MSTTSETQAPPAPAPAQDFVWGADKVMNPVEALMWRAETDPRLRSTIVALEILDCAPDWDRLLAACDWATRLVPRFRQRVFEPLFGLGDPTWVVDEDFDLHYHVRRVRLPADAGFRELLDLAEVVAMAAFDKARSPWEVHLVEGLPDGRAGLIIKMHHSTTDGVGGVQLFSQLHSRKREHDADKPQPAPPSPERPSNASALRSQVQRDVGGLARFVRAGAGGVLRAATQPGRAAREAAEFAASLQRVMGGPDATGSPLLRGRSLSWHFIALDVEFKDLRAASKSAGGSLNDAYLAALMGAFRMYHAELGTPIETMPVAMPINIRREGDDAGGNAFAAARFAGPVAIEDPAERIRRIGRLVRAFRAEPAMNGMGMIAPALARLPGPMVAALAGGITRGNDLQASNVPGIRDDVFVAGARIERSYPFAPLPGCAAMITLLSHGQTCCIGANVDPAAITQPELFSRCLAKGFAEVLALAGDDVTLPLVRT